MMSNHLIPTPARGVLFSVDGGHYHANGVAVVYQLPGNDRYVGVGLSKVCTTFPPVQPPRGYEPRNFQQELRIYGQGVGGPDEPMSLGEARPFIEGKLHEAFPGTRMSIDPWPASS